MSFAMTAINVGFNQVFLSAWLRGWPIGFCVALPLAYFMPPLIQKALRKAGLK